MDTTESEECGIEKIDENKLLDLTLEEELNKIFKQSTTKFLEGRKYVEDKLNDWANAIIDEFELFCKKKIIFFFIFKNISKQNKVYTK